MSTNDGTNQSAPPPAPSRGPALRAAIWLPGLAVALGAAVATAHGLFEAAVAARVPVGIAWLYPLITDGLALVAYAATARLAGSAARYAWSVVVLAAGLSGLAQATYLASGAAVDVSATLRFGVGAWPAIAAAIVAHLLYLLLDAAARSECSTAAVQSPVFSRTTVQPDFAVNTSADVQAGVQPCAAIDPGAEPAAPPTAAAEPRPAQPVESPVRDRARTAAIRHNVRHGALPSVTELEALAQVSRGTAAAVLKHLRQHPPPLHLITISDQHDPEERSQP